MWRAQSTDVPDLERFSRQHWVLLFCESAALLQLLWSFAWRAVMVEYSLHNQAPTGFRLWSAAVPWVGAVAAVGVAWAWLRRRPAASERLKPWVRWGLPVLCSWPAPLLLDRDASRGHALFFMLVAGASTLGLEASLRRADYRFLRARATPASALARRLPRWLAGAAIVAVALFVYVNSVRAHHKMLTSNYDFGLFENLFWNTLHGRHGIALGRHYFAEHAEFLLYGLLPAYALVPRAETLLALQALLMVGAAVPLFLLAERWLGEPWAALAFALAYISHPTLHGPAFYDFHFLPLSAFFILWAAYFHARRPGSPAFWVSAVLAMSCREDVALGAAVVGAGLFWQRFTPASRRVGLVLFALGASWFLLVKFVWMTLYGGQTFTSYYSDLIPKGSRGFGAVLVTLLSNPLYTLRHLLSEQKLLLALQLLVPLAFLPVRYRRVAFLLVPGLIVVGLANSESAIVRVHFHYATHFLPYAFIAALAALCVRPRQLRAPAVAALLWGSLLCSWQWGAFFRERFTTSFHEVSFAWTPGDEQRRAALKRLAARVPDGASVSAGEYEGPHFARRDTLIALKSGIHDADYVIYSQRSLRWGGRDAVIQALRERQYGVVELDGDLALLRRDADPVRNAEALRLLGAR